jgi:hypothetical protein
VANTHAERLWVQSKLPKESHEQYDLLRCLDSNNCYVVGDLNDRIILYKSTDQGLSWSEVFEKYDNEVSGLLNVFNCKMTDSNNIYISYSDKLALEISDNGGKSFRTLLFGELSEGERKIFYDLVFRTNEISAGLTDEFLIYTFDNWESYTIVTIPDSIFAIDLLYFVGNKSIVMYRRNLHNSDFIEYDLIKEKWTVWSRGEIVDIEFEDFSFIEFVNDTLGYACGGQFNGIASQSEDLIWKTTDKGRTWTKLMHQLNDPSFGLQMLSFRNELHGIAVGNWGKILETTNGGKSWFQFPVQEEMIKPGYRVTWAGSIPLIVAWNIGIFRLETVSEVEELDSDEKFRVFQSGHNLEIAINDESHAIYRFSLYNSSGRTLMTRNIKSSFGFVFEPVELIDLTNGVYYYTISKNNGVEFNGKLVVVE